MSEPTAPATPPANGTGAAPETAQAPELKLPELTPEQEEAIFSKRLQSHKFKVKDGDKEVELPTDEILRGFRMRRDSDKRFEEAAAYRKQAEQLAELFQKDPWEAFKRMGMDPDELAMSRIRQRMQYDEMSPEQRAVYQERMQRQELERKLAEYKEKEAMTAQEREIATARQRIESEFMEAIDAAKVPRSPTLTKRMAEIKYAYAQKGADVPAKDCLAIAIDSLKEEHNAMYDSMEPDLIKNLFPKVAEKLRKAELAQVQQAPKTPKQAAQRTAEKPKKRYISERDWENKAWGIK